MVDIDPSDSGAILKMGIHYYNKRYYAHVHRHAHVYMHMSHTCTCAYSHTHKVHTCTCHTYMYTYSSCLSCDSELITVHSL